jgi:hypothetical protein
MEVSIFQQRERPVSVVTEPHVKQHNCDDCRGNHHREHKQYYAEARATASNGTTVADPRHQVRSTASRMRPVRAYVLHLTIRTSLRVVVHRHKFYPRQGFLKSYEENMSS